MPLPILKLLRALERAASFITYSHVRDFSNVKHSLGYLQLVVALEYKPQSRRSSL